MTHDVARSKSNEPRFFFGGVARYVMLIVGVCSFVTGCEGNQRPADVASGSVAQPSTSEESSLLSEEQVASIREAVEQSGGALQRDADGQPVAIDLAAGRGSADVTAFEAALRCPTLRVFRARAGQLAIEDLAKIATLTSLEELMLEDAALNDDVLGELARNLRGLRRLTLRNAPHVTDHGIAELISLSELTHLTLIDLQVSGQALPTITELPVLVSLDLRKSQNIRGDGLAALGDAPKLKEVKVGGLGIDDAAMAIVANLPHLESLTIEDASITSEGIEALRENRQTAKRIVALTFARCSALDDDALPSLASLPNLRRLSLRDVPVTGSFLPELPTLRKLESLSLNETFLDDNAFNSIAACRSLKRLELAQSFLTTEAMEKISTLTSLEYLNLSNCGLNSAMLEPLAGLQNLKTLIVDGNPDVSREAAARLLPSNK